MLCGMTETQRVWVERLHEWKESGKTLREFAEGQPYKAVTLAWWGSEFRRRGLLAKTGPRRRRAMRRNAPQLREYRAVDFTLFSKRRATLGAPPARAQLMTTELLYMPIPH